MSRNPFVGFYSNAGDFLYRYWAPFKAISPLIGYDQARLQKEQTNVQIGYDQYMARGNQRALDDWNRLYGSKGLSIRYPELSYPGAVAGYNAGISRSYIANDTADTNAYKGAVYGTAGLYGISSRVSRRL